MTILSKIKSHSDANNYLKEFPFFNKPIERPIKCLENTDQLVELPLYEQLNITKTDQAFKGYAMSYNVEIIKKRSKCTIRSKLSIKNLFNDLLNELKGFKYQITVEVFFNSETKTATNHMFK